MIVPDCFIPCQWRTTSAAAAANSRDKEPMICHFGLILWLLLLSVECNNKLPFSPSHSSVLFCSTRTAWRATSTKRWYDFERERKREGRVRTTQSPSFSGRTTHAQKVSRPLVRMQNPIPVRGHSCGVGCHGVSSAEFSYSQETWLGSGGRQEPKNEANIRF